MCLSGISGSEAHGDEVMVLVASLATVVGDRGSERDLCVGWFSMLICSEVRRRRGSRARQGPERPHCLPGRFAGVCSDCYRQLVEMARARRKLLLVLAVLGKRDNGGFVWDSGPGCTILLLGRDRKGAQRPAS